MGIPDFFIVGAPKCGTTAMYRWLAAHPEIFLPTKELHYFGADLDHRRPAMSEAEYRALFAEAQPTHSRVGEVAVWYLMSESAAAELKAFSPEAQIIIMLRRPDQMLYSLHSQLLYSGDEDLEDFGDALDAEPDRLRGERIPGSTHTGLEAPPSECLLYTRVGAFAAQVKRYQDTFGPDRVHVILHEDLKADAAAVFRKVLEFLGVDASFEPDFSVINPNTRVRSQGLRKLVQGLRWGVLRDLTPAPMRSWGRAVFEGLQAMNTEVAQRDPLDPDVAARVRTALADDVTALSGHLERDLSHWLQD